MAVTILETSVFFLACYGSAALISASVSGTVLDRKPFTCVLCTSFWVASILAVMKFYVPNDIFYWLVMIPPAVAGFSNLIQMLFRRD